MYKSGRSPILLCHASSYAVLVGQTSAGYFSGEKHSAIVVTEQQDFCLVINVCCCGSRRAEFFSAEKHSALVVAEEQKILQLW